MDQSSGSSTVSSASETTRLRFHGCGMHDIQYHRYKLPAQWTIAVGERLQEQEYHGLVQECRLAVCDLSAK